MTRDSLFFDAAATPEEMQRLGDALDAFNAVCTGVDDEKPIRLAVRDGDGKLVGGLRGVTGWRWLYVITLWIDEAYRKTGLGSRLMDMAEAEAVNRGCENACLSSYSFQAPEFYRRRGYEVFGKLEDYPAGHTMYFLRKRLTRDGS